jgi:hypothetical protein
LRAFAKMYRSALRTSAGVRSNRAKKRSFHTLPLRRHSRLN